MEDQYKEEYTSNVRFYYKNGLYHRDNDLPAIIADNGSKHWFINGKRHRIGNPAVMYSTGSQIWYFDDVMHREDGPAYIIPNVNDRWYFRGKRIHCSNLKEFKRLVDLLVFI